MSHEGLARSSRQAGQWSTKPQHKKSTGGREREKSERGGSENGERQGKSEKEEVRKRHQNNKLVPHRPSRGGSIKLEERVVGRDAGTPGNGSGPHNTKISQQFPKPSDRMALQSSRKERGRGLALTQAAVHLTPPTLHGSQGTQAKDSPSLLMLAGRRNTQSLSLG